MDANLGFDVLDGGETVGMRLRREGIGPGSTHWWFIIQGVSCLSRPESPGYSVGQCSAVATLDWRIRMIGCVSPWIYMCVLVFLTCARKRRNNNKQERRPEVEVAAFIEPKPVTYRKYCIRMGHSSRRPYLYPAQGTERHIINV